MRTAYGALVGMFVCLMSGTVNAAGLPSGQRVEGRTSGDRPASYSLETDGPGVLAVVVRADDDVVINVLNDEGRPVADGRIDIDYRGDLGAEQGMIILNNGGRYEVRVEPLSAAAGFVLMATWLPIAEVALDADPMGSAVEALDLEVNETHAERIDNADREDWFRVVAPDDGLLLVATKARGGDVILDCYAEDDPVNSIQQSDRDISGDLGREAILLDVHAGDVYYFVVTAHGDQADYSIRAVITDN